MKTTTIGALRRWRFSSQEVRFKADLDLEPVAVEFEDFDRPKRQQGGHQDDPTSGGVVDEDEPDETADGSPKEIDREVADLNVGFPVDRTPGG